MKIRRRAYILTLMPFFGYAQESSTRGVEKVIEFCFTSPIVRRVPVMVPGSKLKKLKSHHELIKIEVTINVDGSIEHLQLINGPKIFQDDSINWAKDFLFFPAIAGNQACKSKAYIFLRAKQELEQLEFSFEMSTTPRERDWLPIPKS